MELKLSALIKIDWKLVDRLCEIKCTTEEICAVLGIHEDTLNNHSKKEHKMTIKQYIRSKGYAGNVSLRRAMYISAVHEKDTGMMKFLAKSPAWLNMTEKTEISFGDDHSRIMNEITKGLKEQDEL